MSYPLPFTGNQGANVLNGAGGNDTLIGGVGNDKIDGGLGDDTAVFSHNFNDCTDTLGSIARLQFGDATITPVDDGNALFDALNYLSRNADVFHAGVNALDHFNAFGWDEGRDPNPYFDVSAYLAANKDVAAAGINPLDHYHQSGWHEGRDPSAWFDTTLYLICQPDTAAAPARRRRKAAELHHRREPAELTAVEAAHLKEPLMATI